MKLVTFYEIIFQLILVILAFYHIYKREFKYLKSIVLIFVLSYLSVLSKIIFQIEIDILSNLIYLLILFMALYLGSSFFFYDKYKWWDRSIHFLSGVSFVGIGIAVTNNDSEMGKGFILLFSFTFSITLHAFWEVLEYISDCVSHGNAQRWQRIHSSHNHVSEKAMQPAGLVDTMNDIICCIFGSGLAVAVWCIII
ncbi:hypothetical protein acsn021_22080 [Anaerocolumna cellulosilytica]|uniref:Uncharacterized protein n=1 Tax=Anaerocolumna cellulosilytica TaxID=433286 RepID=A0A6S6R017_9FIRM|nr:hypothetical protein [Anaerocolumna cellulosilytica]MBB5194149.1 hypothetical protein [Anaerocolumna cellulosilytica]BCJ94639.1 hypothetical protein acsn021_22080 [Anaerocolumna cellulosilytica]